MSLPRVAVTGLQGVGVDALQLSAWAEHLGQELSNTGLPVVTAREVAALLGIERQRQLLGCDEAQSSACVTELANALGSELTVAGDVSKTDDGYKVTLKLISTSTGERAAGYAETVGSVSAVYRALSRGGWRMGSLLVSRTGHLPVGAAPEAVVHGEPPPGRSMSWLPLTFGLLSLGAGIGMAMKANDDLNQLSPRTPITLEQAMHYRDEGKTLQPLGLACIGVGVAAIAAGSAMYFVGGGHPRGVQISLMPTPTGGGVALAGWLP